MTAALLASLIVLTNAFGSVQVETLGARVVSYAPQGGEEVFAMLPSGYGGVPLCWPWFRYLGPKSDSPKHGIARYREFAVVRRTDGPAASEVELRLDSNAATRKDFPHDFTLTVTVRLDQALSLTMTAKNTGVTPFKVTEAFHPYLFGNLPHLGSRRPIAPQDAGTWSGGLAAVHLHRKRDVHAGDGLLAETGRAAHSDAQVRRQKRPGLTGPLTGTS